MSELEWVRDEGGVGGWRAESGGSQPVTQQQYEGDPITVANSASGFLTWDLDDGPDSLIDVADPASPTFLAAGTYAVSVKTHPWAGLNTGGSFVLDVILDADGDFPAKMSQASAPATVEVNQPDVSVAVTWKVPVGAVLQAKVTNHDGTDPADFGLYLASIVKLT